MLTYKMVRMKTKSSILGHLPRQSALSVSITFTLTNHHVSLGVYVAVLVMKWFDGRVMAIMKINNPILYEDKIANSQTPTIPNDCLRSRNINPYVICLCQTSESIMLFPRAVQEPALPSGWTPRVKVRVSCRDCSVCCLPLGDRPNPSGGGIDAA